MDKHWNLDNIYEGHEDPRIEEDFEGIQKEITLLEKNSSIVKSAEDIEKYFKSQEAITRLFAKIYSYANLCASVNTNDKKAANIVNRAGNLRATLPAFEARFLAGLKKIENIDALIEASEYNQSIKFMIKHYKKLADKRLTEAEEKIMSIMKLNASNMWSNLFKQLVSKHMVEMVDGSEETLSVVRSMASDNNPKVRKEAYEAEIASYSKIEDSIAAALNSIKGQVIHEAKLRGYTSPLEMTLQNTRMTKKTLDAMIEAIEEGMPILRKYLRLKAEKMGYKNGLPFYELVSPMGDDSKKYSYDEACKIVTSTFETYSTKMADTARKAFAENWIDAFPAKGKVNGAFCYPLANCDEFRVLLNFNGNLGDVFTLAHELGHGYHDIVSKRENIINLSYPMTLAETASTFAETLLANKLLNEEKSITILDSVLEGAASIIIDIYSRYLFETRVFEARKTRHLFAEDFKEIMTEAQKNAYGDALDPEFMHPYMWACKTHYYSADNNFYNYPYSFGYLLATGLYLKFKNNPEDFKPKYDKMLQSAGKMMIEDACKIVDIDCTDKKFWLSSFDVFKEYVELFESL